MNLEVNKRIKEAREKARLSQNDVAKLMGMKCSTYSQMERKGSISVDKALKLAEILSADSDYIIYGKLKEEKIDFTPEPPQVIKVEEPKSFLDKIRDGEDVLVLTRDEKNIIKTFRNMKKSQKSEFFEYLKRF